MKDKKLKVSCPKCKKKFFYHESKFRPFCSEKCKMIDLGKWLSGEYTIPVKNVEEIEKDPTDEE